MTLKDTWQISFVPSKFLKWSRGPVEGLQKKTPQLTLSGVQLGAKWGGPRLPDTSHYFNISATNDSAQYFSSHGKIINVHILKDQFTSQSKGVGFVLYDKKCEAEAAITAWNNTVPPGGKEVCVIWCHNNLFMFCCLGLFAVKSDTSGISFEFLPDSLLSSWHLFVINWLKASQPTCTP